MPFLKGADLLIVLGIMVILFGAPLLPRIARSWGRAIRELRSMNKEDSEKK